MAEILIGISSQTAPCGMNDKWEHAGGHIRPSRFGPEYQ